MTTETTLQASDLCRFTGTAQWYRHPLMRDVLYTDGAKHVAEAGAAYWLLDEIALAQRFTPSLAAEAFQSWTLRLSEEGSAVLTCTDGNDRALLRKRIPFTDFPLPEITLFYANRTILLPSEW